MHFVVSCVSKACERSSLGIYLSLLRNSFSSLSTWSTTLTSTSPVSTVSLGQLNMRLALWTSALAAVFARLSTSHLHNITGPFPPLSDGSQPVKRWYGVPEGDKTTILGGWGPWPVMCKEPEPVQAIRYCFKDKRSADNLQPIVDQVSVHSHTAR